VFSGEEGNWGITVVFCRSQKMLNNQRIVSLCFVVILGPGVVAPIFWTLMPDVLAPVTLQIYNSILRSPPVLVEQISYARCFQYFATFFRGSGRSSSRTLFVID